MSKEKPDYSESLIRDGSFAGQAIFLTPEELTALREPDYPEARETFMKSHDLQPGTVWVETIGGNLPVMISTEQDDFGTLRDGLGRVGAKHWKRDHPMRASIDDPPEKSLGYPKY